MKKIIVVLLLAVALKAESVSLEKQEECLRHLEKADEFMQMQLNLIADTNRNIFWTKINTISQIVTNLQERYNICMRNAKIWKQL